MCGAAFAFGLAPARAIAAKGASRPLATLTTAHQAHNLNAAEARKGHPIHFRAQITYYDRYMDPRMIVTFVHDATGAMFVSVPPNTPEELPPGTLVDLQGTSGMGEFAPIILSPRVATLKTTRPLPDAPQVGLMRLLTGEEDGQWVKVEGIVHSVFQKEHEVTLQLTMRDGLLPINVPRQPGVSLEDLVDARVSIRANAAPLFNPEGQMIGVRLFCPGRETIQVLEAGPPDILASPVRRTADLFQYGSVTPLVRRVHVRGQVTLAWPGSLLCIRDATRGLCARSTQLTPVTLGEWVDLAGFPEISDDVPSLGDAVFREVPAAAQRPPTLVPPLIVTAEQAQSSKHDSEVVQMEGRLLGRNVATADTSLMLNSGGVVYSVVLPQTSSDEVSAGWKEGSLLRVTGICAVQIDAQRTAREGGAAKTKAFRLLLRSSKDVVVLQRPSWWTPAHTVPILTVGLTITLTVLVWVAVLSRRLKQKTQLIGESEERFRHIAQHDFLTDLPTRMLLRERIDAAIEKTRATGKGLALLMLDLDKFKQINDALGHHAGDGALRVTASRAIMTVRSTDTVARISGDEFVVLLTDLADEMQAAVTAARLVQALSEPFAIGDREVPLSTSVGVCADFTGRLTAETLLKRADAALYYAKAGGRNRFHLYTEELARASEEAARFQAALECALAQNEMEVHYQPMVDFRTRELTGFEALLRWRNRERGLVMPTDFIPVAEQTGLIIPIGEWVLRESCRQIGALEKQLGRTFVLAVNLSPGQIQQQQDFSERVKGVLEAAGRSPNLLEFEITESLLMNDSDLTHATLLDLQAMGVRLAIDDFGVGFSSLSYITRFSIDRLKIDRSFVSKSLVDSGVLAVVRAMVSMAHGLSIQVVAEGVESDAEFQFLRDEGCDTAQGYFLGRPEPEHGLVATVHRLAEQAAHCCAALAEAAP